MSSIVPSTGEQWSLGGQCASSRELPPSGADTDRQSQDHTEMGALGEEPPVRACNQGLAWLGVQLGAGQASPGSG